MENYGQVLKRRREILIGLLFMVVVAIVLTKDTFTDSFNISRDLGNNIDFIHGFRLGLFIAFELILTLRIIKIQKAQKNEDLLEAMYITEHDERSAFINAKISNVGFNALLIAIAIATIIAGSFHIVVFYTLFSVLLFAVAIKGICKVYYHKKY